MQTQNPSSTLVLKLHAQDDVAIALIDLSPGTALDLTGPQGDPSPVLVQQLIPSGHKVALCEIAAGAPVHRYGYVIGFASRTISPGEHVHTHNLGVQDFKRDYAFGQDVRPVTMVPESERRTFLGYRRANGRVGTRNYVAVISTVNCSAHVAREIARYFTPERLAAYPNVDGVIPLTHSSGCSFRIGGPDHVMLQRVLSGMARHPNVGAYILVGLGCETNQMGALIRDYDLHAEPFQQVVIQDLGGIQPAIQAGIGAVQELLPAVDRARRTPQPLSELMLALHCGGSDGWSGVTANPLVGRMADQIVRQGGTIVVSETPEIYGAEQLLTRRAVDANVGKKLIAQIQWWEAYARRIGAEIDNNPSPGNKAGGLTTIYEKSMGAVAKAGSTPLAGVYEYAEPVTARGFTFMNGPGNDWVTVTGQVAGGCTLIVFTTGRGSVFGFKPAPTIKVSTNSTMFERMAGDMDLNAGKLLEGAHMEEVSAELLDLVVDVASGRPSKSEAQGVGESEFCPWSPGGVL